MSNKHYLDASKVKKINTENTAVPTSNCTCNISPSPSGGCGIGMYIFILIILILIIAGGFYMIKKNKI
jgi:hypothetical protein